jgi:uncharacterized oxidoreductase
MKLTNRTILITGGSAGIGLAFALKFLELGNRVLITGRRQAVLDDVKSKHSDLHVIRSDVADPAQIAALAESIKRDFPELDVLVNNAGISRYKNLSVPASDLDDLMTEVNINVGGVVRMTSAFIDLLKGNTGTLINVSSALALRFQLEDSGVEVIELMPPAVRTEMTADLPDEGLSLITTDKLVTLSMALLKRGALEVRPGQSAQLALLRRVAPGFINRQLWKAAKSLVPAS